MIRALQKKFVITSMTAISVLLLVLLGGINITNIVLSEKETSRTLGWITAQELGEFPDKPFSGNKSTAPDADKPPEPPSPFGQERNAKDAILSSNYFVVRTDLTGAVLSTDVTRVSTLSEEDAAALASAIWQAAGLRSCCSPPKRRWRTGSRDSMQGQMITFRSHLQWASCWPASARCCAAGRNFPRIFSAAKTSP